MKLSEVYKLFEADKRIEGFSLHTFKAYKIQLNLLIKHFGDKDIETFNLFELKQYLAKDSERLKPSSIGHRVRFIRSIFRYAHEEGITESFIAAKLKEPKEGKRVPKFIPEEALHKLDAACEGPREKALNALLYATGCRIGEVHLMNRSHINWMDRSLIVLGKGDKEREVYFDVKTSFWIQSYLDTRTDDDPALFVSERKVNGTYKRATIHQLRYTIKRIAKRAKVDINIYPHRYRHSFCTHLIDRGAPMEVISQLAGHQKIETTKIYAQLSGERRRELYRKYF